MADVVVVDERAQGLSAGPHRAGIAAPAQDAARAARRTLAEQVARLERELGETLVAAYPRHGIDVSVAARARGPRLLGLGELEALRDDLADRLALARAEVTRRGEREQAARELLESMLVDPRRHKFVRLPNTALGEGGCGVWQVRPRLGLVGMLMGWWQVKLSSGCPLAPQ
jgi:hypothetical protein